MLSCVSGINSSTVTWYASRSTGVVALLLLTIGLVVGVLINRQGRLPGLPRFAVTGLHRNLSLIAVVFVVLHVLLAVFDGYVTIPLAAAVVPFVSGYEGFAIGLGAISLDLMAAMIITSLLRRHMSMRVWQLVHWLAYVSWPVAFLHTLLSSGDPRHGWMLALLVISGISVAAAGAWRLIAAKREIPRAERVPAVMRR